jgi:hypothetical protein
MLSVITMAVLGSVKRMDCTRWMRRVFFSGPANAAAIASRIASWPGRWTPGKMTVASGAYQAAKASVSPSAHARDVWTNTARMALSWLVPGAVAFLVVMVVPF